MDMILISHFSSSSSSTVTVHTSIHICSVTGYDYYVMYTATSLRAKKTSHVIANIKLTNWEGMLAVICYFSSALIQYLVDLAATARSVHCV